MQVCLPALPLLAAALLAGCGGGSTASSSSVPISPASAPIPGASTATVPAADADAVALVSGAPISKTSYQHWLTVEKTLGASSPSHQALGFLITSEWVLGEAGARHIAVSDAEVKQRFAQLVHQSFSKSGSLQKYLAKSGETEADLLARIKVELLASRIATKVTSGKSSAQRSTLLSGFETNFHTHWKSLTICHSGYVMEDCKQYRGKPEDLTATSSNSSSSSNSGASSASGSTSSHASTNSASSSNGEVYTQPGGFSLSSSAFEHNGAIPTQYTCAGAGISPPLSWQKVPAHAAELVLFVIDDNAKGSSGGIRWIVGGISPSSTGVAAGQVPPGGILGTNSAGKVGYSPICPDHGKSDTVEFIMYALKNTIQLSPGFQPSQAEAQYGSRKLLMGSAAITYGVASR
jgi:phosphatidylethanolamine-binding protein (PEBP) family uncharacterized protein